MLECPLWRCAGAGSAFFSSALVAIAYFGRKGQVVLKHYDVSSTLINSTISVIANEGLDRTTTKAIVHGTSINEAYIYRYFSDKEDLLAKTFAELDDELVTKVMHHIDIMYMREMDYETRCRLFFAAIWGFMLGNRDKCLAYVRYYYSPYFHRNSAEEHRKRYAPLVKRFGEAFRAESNVWMILNHILNVMLDFAVKVYNGEMPADDDYSEHVFRVIYASVQQYFRNEKGNVS